jgi:hypothetical protein
MLQVIRDIELIWSLFGPVSRALFFLETNNAETAENRTRRKYQIACKEKGSDDKEK